jgi:alpha-tubulin suppressor-like RCC1 family protein
MTLKEDGTVVEWGSDSHAPEDLFDIKEVAAGGYFTVALTQDGSVVAWGNGE